MRLRVAGLTRLQSLKFFIPKEYDVDIQYEGGGMEIIPKGLFKAQPGY